MAMAAARAAIGAKTLPKYAPKSCSIWGAQIKGHPSHGAPRAPHPGGKESRAAARGPNRKTWRTPLFLQPAGGLPAHCNAGAGGARLNPCRHEFRSLGVPTTHLPAERAQRYPLPPPLSPIARAAGDPGAAERAPSRRRAAPPAARQLRIT